MRRRTLIAAFAALVVLAPVAGRAEGEGGGPKTKPPYLQMPTVAVSVFRSNGRRGVLTIEVGVDVPDPALRNQMELYVPLLISAYVSALQPYAISLAPGQPPNADYISMTLQRETDRVLRRRGAHLLLGSILVN
ncbi:MAG TPA: Tat pathway signal protein [Caulobacteraceae bacterium]